WIAGNYERARLELDYLCEDFIEVTFCAGTQHTELQPEGMSRCLQLLRVGFGKTGVGWIDEQGHDARRGDQLVQQLQLFWRDLYVRLGHARDIAARSIKAGDEVELHRVAEDAEDNGNCSGRRLCRERRRSTSCGNNGHLTMDQISHHFRQPISLILCPAIFDGHVLSMDVTDFA